MSDIKKGFDAVVISGGGTKGILALGSLHYYYEKGLYRPGGHLAQKISGYESNCDEYAATSIGAVISLLLICGYTPMEIFKEIYSMESFFSVTDCHNFWNVINYMGLMSINGFAEKIEGLVRRKLDCVPTLEQLQKITGCSLLISGANVTRMAEEKYSPTTHPNLGCVNAIKISCNLPLIFQRIKYKTSYVVDGGLLNNFPCDYISTTKKNILGIVVMGSDYSLPDDTFMGYFYRLLVMPINALTELRCQLAPPTVTIVKATWNGVPLLQFTMSSKTKMDMFLKGYQAAERGGQMKLLVVEGWDFNKAGEVTRSGSNMDDAAMELDKHVEIANNEDWDNWDNLELTFDDPINHDVSE